MKKLDFIENRMFADRGKIVIVLIILFIIVFIPFAIISFECIGYVFGLKELNSLEKIDRFYNSEFKVSNMEFDNVIDTEESFSITTTYREGVTVISPFGGGTIPTTEREVDKFYDVYILETKDANIILCTKQGEKLDFSKNKIKVANANKEISQDVLEEFSVYNINNKAMYVFYTSYSNHGAIKYLLLILISLLILIISIRNSKLLRKTTKVAKQIRKIGDYETVLKDINEQVKESAYKTNNLAICRDYIICTIKEKTKIIQMKNVKSAESIPDENYPEEIIIIKIEYMDQNELKEYTFQIYDKITEEKVLKCINEGKEIKDEK